MNIYILHFIYYSLSFIIFLFLTWRLSRSNNHQLFISNNPVSKPFQWLLLQVTGIILFGLVLLINKTESLYDILFSNEILNSIQLLCLLICILLILILAFYNNKNQSVEVSKSSINHLYQNLQFVFLYFVVRAAFIVIYEIWFRGYLLYETVKVYGTITAVIINLILYFLIHIFNERKILVGTVIFGLILCLFTIWFKAAWPAVLLHLVLTLSAEGILLINLYKKLKMAK